ncbi:MAG: N-methyl-L-tryptophan oxidase [Cyclobacteriaceae bacterium]|jgi:sarcosine oxidase
MKSFDVIVVGVGSMGSAACYYLSKAGAKVLGLEQFSIPHDHGSHAGQSRIIRKAYFEHADYVPLLHRAYENWAQLEKLTGHQVFYPTGLLYAGPRHHPLIDGTISSAQLHGIALETLTPQDQQRDFPQFSLPDDTTTLLEKKAGFITPERAILLYAEQAIRQGATIKTQQGVTGWRDAGTHVEVTTPEDTYRCDKLVVTAGPWAPSQLPGLRPHLHVTRQVVAWMKPRKWEPFELDSFPCWLVAEDGVPGAFYGFPVLPVASFGAPVGLKVAYHHPGTTTNPDAVDRVNTQHEVEVLVQAVKRFLPQGFDEVLSVKTCLYTNSTDENFIVDFLPDTDKRVVVAAGFSGHGFKFCSVVGEIMTDLALTGKTNLPISFLHLDRLT